MWEARTVFTDFKRIVIPFAEMRRKSGCRLIIAADLVKSDRLRIIELFVSYGVRFAMDEQAMSPGVHQGETQSCYRRAHENIEKPPERVKKHFQDLRVKYVA